MQKHHWSIVLKSCRAAVRSVCFMSSCSTVHVYLTTICINITHSFATLMKETAYVSARLVHCQTIRCHDLQLSPSPKLTLRSFKNLFMYSAGDLAKAFVFATEWQYVNIISTLVINIWYISPFLNSYNFYFFTKKRVMVDAQLAPTYWRIWPHLLAFKRLEG